MNADYEVKLSVEVVLCTFNGEEFIAEQLESILAQSRKVDLISVYDDGSSDATLAKLRAAQANSETRGSRINIIVNESNLGYSKNFAKGIKFAQCDVIFLCDQDDIWEPFKVAQQLEFLLQTNAQLVFSDGILIDTFGNKIAQQTVFSSYGLTASQAHAFQSEALPILLKQNYVNGAALAGYKTCMQATLPIPQDFPHDYWLVLWAACTASVACTPQRLYHYRQHANNVIGIGTTLRPYHQLASIWRNPKPPRLAEIRRLRALLTRLPEANPSRVSAEQKLRWLLDTVEETNRLKRLRAILFSFLTGRYRRFSPPHSFIRDLVAVVR